MLTLQSQYEQWKSPNVVILGINLNESLLTVEGFIRQHQITFPSLLDNDQARKIFKATAYPTTFYIDSNGKIKDVFVGGLKESDILIRNKYFLKSMLTLNKSRKQLSWLSVFFCFLMIFLPSSQG